jgi:hypothetical protein
LTGLRTPAYAPRAMRAAWVVCASFVLFAAAHVQAQAEEERLQLMRESVAYTDVIDAFDGADLFDLNIYLGYLRTFELATLERERTRADGSRELARVAESRRETSQLALGLDVGLLRDVMASLRLPLLLSDARRLRLPDGADATQVAADLADAASGGGAPAPLFALPLRAPARAGLDYLALGGAWAILNQTRSPWSPTWMVRVEGRRALGEPLRACRESESGTLCGTASSEDRDGDGTPDGTRGAGQKPGSSRGMSALLLETRFSRRYRRAEPYAGLSLLVEWQALRKGRAARLRQGSRPGPQTALALGLALIPWENRASFKRFTIDLRGSATHVARGNDYSPLFDALGTSNHPELARARYDGARGPVPATGLAPCVNDEQSSCGLGSQTGFDGRTESAAHLRYGAQLALEVQAARYVRFQLGSTVQVATDHALSDRSPCGGSSAQRLGDDGRACSDGGVDPRHRGVIDAPGRRFLLRDQLLIGVYAQATASF